MLVTHTADEFRHQLIKGHGMTAKVPYHDVVRVLYRNAESLVNFQKTVDCGRRVDLQVDIEHLALFAVKSEPKLAFRDSDAKLHEKE